MQTTDTFEGVLPDSILTRYEILEVGSAAKIIEAVCPNELAEVISVLDGFELTAQLLLSPGGSRGPVPTIIDSMFDDLGWIEARVDMEKKTYFFPGHDANLTAEENEQPDYLVSRTYQKGYSIDNVKGKLALDVEWNPKDGNLDRDFAAYRAWFDEGVIVASILVTRLHESTRDLTRKLWQDYIDKHPELASEKQLVDYRTSTTANFEKAVQRVIRGDLGNCPILVFGIGEKTWDGKAWDGSILRWNKDAKALESKLPSFEKGDTEPLVTYEVLSL